VPAWFLLHGFVLFPQVPDEPAGKPRTGRPAGSGSAGRTVVPATVAWHVGTVTRAPAAGEVSRDGTLDAGRRLFAAVLVVCLVLGSAAGLLAWTAYCDARSSALAGVELRSQTLGANVYGNRLALVRLLQAVATEPGFVAGAADRIGSRLPSVEVDQVGFTGGLAWIDPSGTVRAATRGTVGTAPGGTWWRDVLGGQDWTTSPALTSPAFTGEVMVFAVPTRDRAGRVNGVLAAGWGMRWLRLTAERQAAEVGERFYGPNTRLLVVDRGGQLVVAPGLEATRDVSGATTYRRMAAGSARFDSGSLSDVAGLRGEPDQVIGFTRIGTFGELVVLQRPASDAFAEPRRVLVTWWVGILTLSALALVSAAATGARIDRLTRERDRLHQAEHDVVADLQRWLLAADLPEGALGRYQPAPSVLNAGGDWYDVVPLGDGRQALLVGDVVGHGVTAALAMGQLRTVGHALAGRVDGPAALLSELDVHVAGLTDVAFCTAACVFLDPAAGVLRYASAGHPPPLLRHPDGTVVRLTATAPPLGLVRIRRAEHTLPVPAGSLVVLYTDGLVEVRDEVIDEGIDRLAATVATGDPAEPGWPERTIAAVRRDRPATDDIALLCYTTRVDQGPRHRDVAVSVVTPG
jgi:serine phosphatase RsbU (regulator of sigma subunit)